MVITQTNAPNLPNATKTRFTPDEYRAIEETAEESHEYCNAEILAISGGSEVHRAIACNLMSLPIDSDDRVVWRLAQSNQMILLTANGSMNGENSLEQVKREEITSTSLPVITISDAERAC